MKGKFRPARLVLTSALMLSMLLSGCSATDQVAEESVAQESSVEQDAQEASEVQDAQEASGAQDGQDTQEASENQGGSATEETVDEDASIADESSAGTSGNAASNAGAVSDAGAASDAEDLGAVEAATGESYENVIFSASGEDQSAVFADGATDILLDGVTIIKDGGDASSADDSSFRGVNAAVRVIGGAEVTIKNALIEASAENATAVFAYDGGTVYLYDSTVISTGGGAGGIQVAGGGILYAYDLYVESTSKAAIRSDRGGGTMVVDGGTYISHGSNGCPAIYSTADITVKNATLLAEQSRAVIIEGRNSVTLENCDLTGNYTSSKSGSVAANVLIYQSASGDATEGTGEFTMTGGSLTSTAGAMFYVTNTDAVITLDGVTLNGVDGEALLIASAGRWGKDGRNGGDVVLNATNQVLSGDIIVDEISTLKLTLTASELTGAINPDGEAGEVSVKLDADSTWTLTGDSYITSFDGDLSNVVTNGFTLYVNGKAVTE